MSQLEIARFYSALSIVIVLLVIRTRSQVDFERLEEIADGTESFQMLSLGSTRSYGRAHVSIQLPDVVVDRERALHVVLVHYG